MKEKMMIPALLSAQVVDTASMTSSTPGIQSIKWTSKITQTGDFQLDWEITRDYENGDGEDYKKIIGALNEEVNPPWGKIARIVV